MASLSPQGRAWWAWRAQRLLMVVMVMGLTVRGKGRASETPVMSLRKQSQRRGLPYPDSIPLSHTHVQLLLVPFLQDSPRAWARTPGPLGPLVGCRILGAWRSPAPQCPGCTYGSIFPSPGLWTASPVPGLCSRPLILGWVSHMPRSPPAASLAPTHSQQRDGPDPLAWGGEGCSSPARWAPSGATVLGALKAA